MDRGQTFDVVDTPPPDKWPSLEEFEEIEEIIKWRDLPKGMYKILETYNQGRNRYGPSVVLKLKHKKGPVLLTWAPSSLVYALEKRKSTNFILNLGADVYEDTGGIFYDFRVF